MWAGGSRGRTKRKKRRHRVYFLPRPAPKPRPLPSGPRAVLLPTAPPLRRAWLMTARCFWVPAPPRPRPAPRPAPPLPPSGEAVAAAAIAAADDATHVEASSPLDTTAAVADTAPSLSTPLPPPALLPRPAPRTTGPRFGPTRCCGTSTRPLRPRCGRRPGRGARGTPRGGGDREPVTSAQCSAQGLRRAA